MDAMKQQLDEIKETIKKAEDRREKLFVDKDRAWEKVQDQINKLEDQKLFLMQQLGESQPPESRKFCRRFLDAGACNGLGCRGYQFTCNL